VEDWVNPAPEDWENRANAAELQGIAALAGIVIVTAAWWALALWPVTSDAPDWLLLTRDVCFGARADTLPNAAGWLVLSGQPIGMLVLLMAVWGAEVRAGLARLMARAAGQVATGAVAALVVVGLAAAVVRVRTATLEPFSAGALDLAAQLTRVSDAAPPLSLLDQAGRTLTLDSFRGRPVILSFAFAHCETVCPRIVSDVLAAQRQLDRERPVVLVVTLDPWRDTPSRLPFVARSWELGPDAYVLSGPATGVERVLNAWRVPRTRNQKTGDIVHPAMVYVIGRDGRIAFVLTGNADTISAAVRAL
jgi:protein SCO1/2